MEHIRYDKFISKNKNKVINYEKTKHSHFRRLDNTTKPKWKTIQETSEQK